MPLVTIPQGKIGYVFARDGKPLEAGQTLASNKSANTFDDVRAFLAAGGQKGPWGVKTDNGPMLNASWGRV